MKKWLIGFAVVIVAGAGWCSPAHAQDLRFGVRFGIDFSNAVALQVRYDFDAPGDGLGVRFVVGTSIILSEAELTGFFRFASDGRGSCGYIGFGFGLLVLPNLSDSPNSSAFAAIGIATLLIGGEYALSETFALFGELRIAPGILGLPVLPLFGLGLNIYF